VHFGGEATALPSRAVERASTVGTVACFSMSLAVASVAVPILIVQAGYTVAQVGFFVALSAVSQVAVSFRIGAVMRRVADKHLVGDGRGAHGARHRTTCALRDGVGDRCLPVAAGGGPRSVLDGYPDPCGAHL
jgi:hypothetical protein